MLRYKITTQYFIREEKSEKLVFIRRSAIPKELVYEIFRYCNQIKPSILNTISFSKLKSDLYIPDYAGLELFRDIKKGCVELVGDDIIVLKTEK